jgi:S-adenosylmethionine:tRNA ribosyltransferase-isomerase
VSALVTAARDAGRARPQASTSFALPEELSATEPPEARGLRRDEVRLLVAGQGRLRHAVFTDLGAVLQAGDVVVVNTSATLPAAVDGWRADGTAVSLHLAGPTEDGGWLVELRTPVGGRIGDVRSGEEVHLPAGASAVLLEPHPQNASPPRSRLWRARLRVDGRVLDYLHQVGRPITYGHLRGRWPLASYQTIFGREPGSAEMPSAARPFSARVLTDLAIRGVLVAPLTLHTGVSSLDADEVPPAERFRVPPATARLVNAVRAGGGRVIAAGTTVVRALETTADADGEISAGEGWTDLVLGPDRGVRAVDGLLTGWHDPDASHLLLLEAVAGAGRVQEAYTAALEARYRWHEFGDSCLLLRR